MHQNKCVVVWKFGQAGLGKSWSSPMETWNILNVSTEYHFVFSLSFLKKIKKSDDRFPEYGKVEFVFSYGPEKIQGITFL